MVLLEFLQIQMKRQCQADLDSKTLFSDIMHHLFLSMPQWCLSDGTCWHERVMSQDHVVLYHGFHQSGNPPEKMDKKRNQNWISVYSQIRMNTDQLSWLNLWSKGLIGCLQTRDEETHKTFRGQEMETVHPKRTISSCVYIDKNFLMVCLHWQQQQKSLRLHNHWIFF